MEGPIRHLLLAITLAGFSFVSRAADPFQYVNGKCINTAGEEGLNPTFYGPCSDFRGVDIGKINMDGRDLRGSRFDNANLQKVSCQGCQLEGTNFTAAQLSFVDFDSANMNFAIFSRALVNRSQFTNTVAEYLVVENTTINLSSFSASDISHGVWKDSTLSDIDLSETDLSSSKFVNTKLSMIKCDATNFSSANLQNANLSRMDLKNTNFTKADLSGSDLRNSQLSKVNFSETILDKAQYSAKTSLPFSKEEAEKRGMIFFKIGNVYIIGDFSDQNAFKVLGANLEKLGHNYSVFNKDPSDFAGDIDFSKYDVVLYFNRADYSTDMNENGQKKLIEFVKNGGIFISSLWTNYMLSIDKLKLMDDLVITEFNSDGATCIVEESNYVADLKQAEESGLFESADQIIKIKYLNYCSGYNKRQFANSPVKVIANNSRGGKLLFQRQVEKGFSYFMGWNCSSPNGKNCYSEVSFAELISKLSML